MKKTIDTKIQKRFADIDVFRHVNNIHQQEYLDLGKTDYYEHVIGFDVLADRVALMIVSVKTDFVAQVRYEDKVVVRTWVERVGTKSITLRQQIISHKNVGIPLLDKPSAYVAVENTETIHTESETVLVAFDRRDQITVEIPQRWREKIIK